ncbi:hypothetical protein HYS54_02435, partial [Candidatus Micrarchaeota archaeon]|nr:hypothetical protein [Candidatus Micrarchaeota archaeon]
MVEENIHSILRYSLVGYYAVLLFILYWSALFGPEFVNQFSNAIITLLSGPGLGFIIFNVYHHRYKGDKQTGEESRTYFKEFESILAALNKNRKKKLTIDRNAQRAIHDVALSENEGVQNRIFFLSSRAHTFGAIHLSTEIVIVFAMLLGSFMFKTLDIHLFYIILAILVSLAVIKVFPSLMDKDLKLIDELECTWMREPKNRDKINDLIKSYLKWNKQPPASSLQRPKSSPRAKNNTVFTKLQYLAIVVLIVNVIFILFWIS